MLARRPGIVACARLAVAAAMLLATADAPAQEAPAARGRAASATEAALVSEIPCPDPSAYHDGKDWYLFGTGARPFFLQGRSPEPGDWRKVNLQLDYAGFPHRVAHVWRFSIHRHRDGTYHGYGTLHLGQFHTVVAHFAPGSGESWSPGRPITRWRLDGLLVGDPARRDWSAYDAKVVEDEDGTPYLVYVDRRGRDNHILARRLSAPGRVDPLDPPHTLLAPSGLRSEDRDERGGMQLVEGPSLFRQQGHYLLFYSVGDFARANYKLGVAFSDRLIPTDGSTYRKVLRRDERRVWGEQDSPSEVVYLLQSQRQDWPNDGRDLVVGPGIGSVIPIDGRPWLLFHGYRPDDRGRNPDRRLVFKLPIRFDIRGETPTPGWAAVDRDAFTGRQ